MSDAVNQAARNTKVPVFECPSTQQKPNEWGSATWSRWRGNYSVNFGNTNYGQSTKSGVTFGGAPFSFRRSAKFGEITDGLSTTLLMGEVIATVTDPGWGGPISETQIAVGGQTFNAFLTPNSRAFDDVGRLCPAANALNGISGCNLLGSADSDMLNQSFASRSKHTGGVHASMGDGTCGSSVRTSTWGVAERFHRARWRDDLRFLIPVWRIDFQLRVVSLWGADAEVFSGDGPMTRFWWLCVALMFAAQPVAAAERLSLLFLGRQRASSTRRPVQGTRTGHGVARDRPRLYRGDVGPEPRHAREVRGSRSVRQH